MTTSGTTAFNPAYSDLVLEAFDRIQIRGPEITADHIFSAYSSTNLLLRQWGTRGVNLWAVDVVTVNLSKGVATYNLPADTVQLLDCYLRTFSMGPPTNLTPAFTTVNLSATVQVTWAAHGLSVGSWLNIIVPVAIGGLILLGFYQVLSVIDGNNFTITAASAATSGAGPAGAVPQFIATAGSTTITVNLTAHGLLAGQTFNVQVATTVGGLVLSGAYVIVTASANSFTFAAATAAGANGTVSENAGLAQLAGQVMTADPLDRTLTPVSSTDYDAFPDKIQQAPPTNYWFNRQASIPQISPWPVPDANGPYVFQGHRMRKIQDANILASETADLPDRFLDAYCADLTYRLAVKWKPALADARKLDRDEAWGEASRDDSERVPTYLRPDMSAYFR